MTKRRASGKRFNEGGGDLRPIRLAIEPLETRRLLACMEFAGTESQFVGPELSSQGEVSAVPSPAAVSQLDSSAEGEGQDSPFNLPENAPHGTLVGPVIVVDPANEDLYTFYSDDPRFTLDGSNLYFSSGELDFETEPKIDLLVKVFDNTASVFATTFVAHISVGDVNEHPTGIVLDHGSVLEHEPGAAIGNLSVIDPDGQGNYAFYLFDSRFELSGHLLKLVDGVELDYETEPEVILAVAATDGTFEVFDSVRITVIQREEPAVDASSIDLDPRQLAELTAGASVGVATVINPKAENYVFRTSDPRFEMRGNQLKLRDDQQVNATAEPQISLSITATATPTTVGGVADEVTGTFLISVTNQRSPYHNHNLNEDVNGDGYVSPIDALLIINELNANGAHPVPTGIGGTGEPPSAMHDVNGDGFITPMDVLLIINLLNDRRSSREFAVPANSLTVPQSDSNTAASNLAPDDTTNVGGALLEDSGEGESSITVSTNAPTVYDLTEERRRRENAIIDSELESLLDQLTSGSADS